VADPEMSKRGGGRSRKGGGDPEIAKKFTYLGLKSLVLLTFDGIFRAKGGGGWSGEKGGRAGPLGPLSKSATDN
jgi:hypothetical protein